eukprot:403349474
MQNYKNSQIQRQFLQQQNPRDRSRVLEASFLMLDPSNPLNPKYFEEHLQVLRELMNQNPKFKVLINKDRYLYDKDIPHLTFDCDLLKENDIINVLIVDDRKLSKDGIVIGSIANINIASQQKTQLYSLQEMVDSFGMNPYSTVRSEQNQNLFDFQADEFNFQKLRDAQNLDWAEDSIYQGLQSEQNEDFDKALDFYNYAIDLDPLSKDAFQAKGILLKKLNRLDEAETALKEAFKLDNDDRDLELLLREVMLLHRHATQSNQTEELFVSDNRKAGVNKYEEEWEGIPISTGNLLTDIQIKLNDPIIQQSHDNIVKQAQTQRKQYDFV